MTSKVKNYLKRVQEKREYYFSIDPGKLELAVSEGNTKIGKVLNVSIVPVINCKSCKFCQDECYDIGDCRYPSTLAARARNSVLWEVASDSYFEQVVSAIVHHPTYNYFRWHVGGDIPNMEYLEKMIEIAKMFPYVIFWTYTKLYGLVNMYVKMHGDDRHVAIPGNLTIMFSEWRGFKMTNPYGFPEFKAYYSDETVPDGIMECNGNCRICQENHIGCPYGQTVYTRIRNEIKR